MTTATETKTPKYDVNRSRGKVAVVTIAFAVSLAVPGAPLAVGVAFAATWWRRSPRARIVLMVVGVVLCVLQAGVLEWPWQDASGVVGSVPRPTTGP